MKKVVSKLRSNRGSSMILALFLLLVAVMVSSTILGSAATAARNASYGVDRQQSYLTVSSAATALRDSILDSGGSYQKITTHVFQDADFSHEKEPPKESMTPVSGCYGSELQTLVEELIKLNTSPVPREYWILVDGFEPVGMKLVLEKDNRGNTQENGSWEVPCTLTATFSNVVEGNANNPSIPYTPPETPVRIVVVLHGTLKRTVLTTEVNAQYVQEITDSMTWDPKRIQIQKTAPEDASP